MKTLDPPCSRCVYYDRYTGGGGWPEHQRWLFSHCKHEQSIHVPLSRKQRIAANQAVGVALLSEDYVPPAQDFYLCSTMRTSRGACGEEGRLFERRPTQEEESAS